jgi:hypothetical protein
VSAHSASQRGGWLSALVSQVTDFVFEDVEQTIEQPAELVRHRVVAVVAAAPRSGATTVARLLAAELAARADAAAVVVAAASARRAAPPSRAAIRLATAMAGVAQGQPVGRLCVVRTAGASASAAGASASAAGASAERRSISEAARYLAPVVLDLSADGSAAGIAALADRVVVVSSAAGEPALLDAVAGIIGGDPLKVVTRVAEPGDWPERADVLLTDSRLAARAAALGTRAVGATRAQVAALADALEADR